MTIPPDFPWRPRMLTTSGDTVLSVLPDRRLAIDDMAIGGDGLTYTVVSADDFEPDPTDGATVGALAQAVREALDDPHLSVVHDRTDRFWYVCGPNGSTYLVGGAFCAGPTEFAAWLAAWNARPKETR